MKYRHAYHAGNFADVHKHVTLLALLAALKRKEKGFVYFETHAGRGLYDLKDSASESAAGAARLVGADAVAPPIARYLELLAQVRHMGASARLYPGSPWLAVHELREQDRAVFVEARAEEGRALERALRTVGAAPARVEIGDGFARLRAALPPPQRRALTLIDPPYERTRLEFEQVRAAVADALRRFPTGVMAIWYPIKDRHDTERWLADIARAHTQEMLVNELWLYPRDSRVALNGSGLLIVNPPFQLDRQLSVWIDELYRYMSGAAQGGTSVRRLVPVGTA